MKLFLVVVLLCVGFAHSGAYSLFACFSLRFGSLYVVSSVCWLVVAGGVLQSAFVHCAVLCGTVIDQS
jgi:hypothetical protein